MIFSISRQSRENILSDLGRG